MNITEPIVLPPDVWLEAMVGVAGARNQAHRAARLWGAAQALREDIGTVLAPDERAILEPHLATVRTRLDKAAWDAAFAEGRAMGLEEAVEYALSEEEAATPAPRAPERRSADESSAVLTSREKEIATLIAQGLTNRQIASELFVSERTVEHHMTKILRKLKLTSRAQVAAWATERRLLMPKLD